jgi:polysaccharide pyruvyl transferase WcaK-like protein
VLVLWADDRSSNLGVRALAHGMAEFARMAWGANTNVDFQDFKGLQSDVAFDKVTLLRDALLPGSPIGRKVARYDVVLDSGAGDSFTDIYGLRRMAAIMYTQSRVLRGRAALVLGPQTIGPFATRIGRAGAAHILKRADAVLARDPVSSRFATSLGRRPDGQATDVVFALPRPHVDIAQRDVVVNVSGLLWGSDRHVNAGAHREGVVKFCRELQQQGREVTLLAHVLSNPSPDNDVPAIEDVARALAGPVEVIVPGSLDEARAVVGSASAVVGARMHACLNGLSMGVPTVAWAYSRKFAPLLEALGWPYHVDVRKEADLALRTQVALERAESAGRAAAVSVADAARALLESEARRLGRLVVVDHA